MATKNNDTASNVKISDLYNRSYIISEDSIYAVPMSYKGTGIGSSSSDWHSTAIDMSEVTSFISNRLVRDTNFAADDRGTYLGLVKLGFNGNGRSVPVKCDEDSRLFVNIPEQKPASISVATPLAIDGNRISIQPFSDVNNPYAVMMSVRSSGTSTPEVNWLTPSAVRSYLDVYSKSSIDTVINDFNNFADNTYEHIENSNKRFNTLDTRITTLESNQGGTSNPGGSSFVLNAASSSTLGGIKTGFATDNSSKNYAVELDTDNKAYVNVPWTSSTGGSSFTLTSATSNSLGGIKIGYVGSDDLRYYGVELDTDNKAYVRVPWVASTVSGGVADGNNKVQYKKETASTDKLPILFAPKLEDTSTVLTNSGITFQPSTNTIFGTITNANAADSIKTVVNNKNVLDDQNTTIYGLKMRTVNVVENSIMGGSGTSNHIFNILKMNKGDDGYFNEMAFHYGSNDVYVRNRNQYNQTLSDWERLALTSDVTKLASDVTKLESSFKTELASKANATDLASKANTSELKVFRNVVIENALTEDGSSGTVEKKITAYESFADLEIRAGANISIIPNEGVYSQSNPAGFTISSYLDPGEMSPAQSPYFEIENFTQNSDGKKIYYLNRTSDLMKNVLFAFKFTTQYDNFGGFYTGSSTDQRELKNGTKFPTDPLNAGTTMLCTYTGGDITYICVISK